MTVVILSISSIHFFQYLSKAGYCAQGNSFIEDLTGREMLKYIASLRGICSDDKAAVVDFWLTILGLYFTYKLLYFS